MSAAAVMAEIAVQRCVPPRGIPSASSLRGFARAAGAAAPLSLRIVDAVSSQALNLRYRGKDRPTNVLSFPAPALPGEISDAPLGDIVLCAPVIASEAQAQGKAPRAHWAHMVVHGVLHLRGYDHQTTSEAQCMEAIERDILAGLGFADPYGDDDGPATGGR